ncbi:hypothetical protein CROQUDRAFT_88190 [Cronartium quercuum f. sp. fusiforme G11]|uniref:Uncharacterized protein n=1 Tax=Cronartium quercuum f. sp. fusiforme G11 TaxID=708437 RepID=A0A9P6TFW9_9BASI|nr:hypothetical protein CROQUDRAFT_88190 [Cronartium quercuum f. sp. fusiforme G11]
MTNQRRKTTRSERREQPMPKLSMPNCPIETAEAKNEIASRHFHYGQHSSVIGATKPNPKSLPTRKQRLKRERGAELAAKLEVKTNRKAIRQANRNGAKKIYE